jgi:hypothetical protein
MRRLHYLLTLISVIGMSSGCRPRVPDIPKAQLTLHVVDDSGQPVAGARVAVVGFHTDTQGRTDEMGCYVAKLRNASGQVDLMADMKGFYSIDRQTYVFVAHTNDQWLPWNPTVKVRLHRITKPVPMVVKQIDEKLPVLEQAIGFDLVMGDWVKPFGKGEVSDFIFHAERWMRETNRVAGRLKLRFANPDDGLCRVRLPYRDDYGLGLQAMAPETGYAGPWEWRLRPEMDQDPSNPQADLNYDQDANYYFRTRSKRGADGKLLSAMYGKIYYGVQFGVWENRPEFTLKLLYYLNPDGTRNTEFDTRSNLCPNPGTAGGRP